MEVNQHCAVSAKPKSVISVELARLFELQKRRSEGGVQMIAVGCGEVNDKETSQVNQVGIRKPDLNPCYCYVSSDSTYHASCAENSCCRYDMLRIAS